MNLKNHPPVFVPRVHCAEFEKMSKAALMDVVWDLAVRCAGSESPDAIMKEFRETAAIVLDHRKQAAP